MGLLFLGKPAGLIIERGSPLVKAFPFRRDIFVVEVFVERDVAIDDTVGRDFDDTIGDRLYKLMIMG